MMLYGLDGEVLTPEQWAGLFNDLALRRIGLTTIGSMEVSTVWVGINMGSIGGGPPLIFESLVTGGPMDDEIQRYATLDEAYEGHRRLVELVRLDRQARIGV